MRAVLYFFTFVLVAVSAKNQFQKEFEELPPCDGEDAVCNSKSAQVALQAFALGIESPVSVQPIDPLTQDHSYQSDLITMYESSITGLKDSVVTNARWFFIDDIMVGMLLATNLNGKVNYVIDHVIGGTPIKGSGELEFNLEQVQISLIFPFDIIKKDGADYAKVKKGDNVIDFVGKKEFKFNSFVGENNKTDPATLAHLKENIGDFSKVFSDVTEGIKNRISDVLTQAFKSVLGAFPINAMVKDYVNSDIKNTSE